MNKFLFLDGDGVLNSVKDNDLKCEVCTRNALLVKQIIDATDCTVVLSSAWRLNTNTWLKTARSLASYGIEIFDKTPHLRNGTRAEEIETWLDAYTVHPDDRYVALDDEYIEFNDKNEHLVRTNFMYGIQQEHVDKAIAILNKKEPAQF